MMGILRKLFLMLIVTCLFLIPGNSVMADRGAVSPRPVKLSQESQRAIIMHNFKLSTSPEIGFGLSNSKRVYPEEIGIMYPQANGFFSKTKTLYIQVMRFVGNYNFKDDVFIEIPKLDPRAYTWVQEGGPNLWEMRHYLRPVDSDKKRDTE